jgi:hypothetical protein
MSASSCRFFGALRNAIIQIPVLQDPTAAPLACRQPTGHDVIALTRL